MVAAAATVIYHGYHGEYVRAPPPIVVLILLAVLAWTASW